MRSRDGETLLKARYFTAVCIAMTEAKMHSYKIHFDFLAYFIV